ncbi:MAG: monofunctional biosynthetic peptidoglycan transglycosylase [Holophagales bacterium]|nr:monofunctional biosynthetic peptidoglycan transglycosylase [Holophagales bacterium]
MRSNKEKKPLLRRLIVYVLLFLATILAMNVLVALFFRVVPVPFSSFMIQRRVSAWSDSVPYTSRHQWRPLNEISPAMGLAVIAAEDQKFPNHFGFDWQAIEKALAHNERSKRKRGASTITQQTAKNMFLWETRSWLRKGFEVWFTLLLETLWPKKRILEVYLNIVEFGDGVYGVEAASQHYFRKPAKKLKPKEAALLAAVLPNPRKFKVNAPTQQVLAKQAWILKQMRQLGGETVVKDL